MLLELDYVFLYAISADTSIEQKFTDCWGWGTTGPYACKKDLGAEFEYVNHRYKSCGWWRYAYLCKKSCKF